MHLENLRCGGLQCVDVPSALRACYVLLWVFAVDPEGQQTCSLGYAESGSRIRQAQARTKKERTAVRPSPQGLRLQSTKNGSIQKAGPRVAISSLNARMLVKWPKEWRPRSNVKLIPVSMLYVRDI